MNIKDLLIDFLTHCRTEHTVPVVKADIEPIVEGYLSGKNIGNTLVRRSLEPILTDDPKFEILFREGNWSAYDYQLTDMMRELVLRYNELVKHTNCA